MFIYLGDNKDLTGAYDVVISFACFLHVLKAERLTKKKKKTMAYEAYNFATHLLSCIDSCLK